MADERLQGPDDEARARRLRRAELLIQRQRAAAQRRRRGFGVRLPTSMPLVVLSSGRSRRSS
jgi:hypothetical protein